MDRTVFPRETAGFQGVGRSWFDGDTKELRAWWAKAAATKFALPEVVAEAV